MLVNADGFFATSLPLSVEGFMSFAFGSEGLGGFCGFLPGDRKNQSI